MKYISYKVVAIFFCVSTLDIHLMFAMQCETEVVTSATVETESQATETSRKACVDRGNGAVSEAPKRTIENTANVNTQETNASTSNSATARRTSETLVTKRPASPIRADQRSSSPANKTAVLAHEAVAAHASEAPTSSSSSGSNTFDYDWTKSFKSSCCVNAFSAPGFYAFPELFHSHGSGPSAEQKDAIYSLTGTDITNHGIFPYASIQSASSVQFEQNQRSFTLSHSKEMYSKNIANIIENAIQKCDHSIATIKEYTISRPRTLEVSIHTHLQEIAAFESSGVINLITHQLEEKLEKLQPLQQEIQQKLNTIPEGFKTAILSNNFAAAKFQYREISMSTKCAKLMLDSARIEDQIAFLQAAIHINKVKEQAIITNHALLGKKNLEQFDFLVFKKALNNLNEQNSSLQVEAKALEVVWKQADNERKSEEGKLNSFWREVGRGIIFREKEHRARSVKRCEIQANKAYLAWQDAVCKQKSVQQILNYSPEILTKKEIEAYHELAQAAYVNPELAMSQEACNTGLMQAVMQTHTEQGAVHSKKYYITDPMAKALDTLGFHLAHKDFIECQGNRAQIYVFDQLMNSLNRLGTISQKNLQVQALLKEAIRINKFGLECNKEQNISQALQANLACDAIIDYASLIADLGVAAGEGVVDGVKSTALSLAHLGVRAVDAVTFPENAIPQVQEKIAQIQVKFDKAVLAMSKFFIGMREEFELVCKGDEASLKELEDREAARVEYAREFMEPFIQLRESIKNNIKEMSWRDRVKLLSKFGIECLLFGKIGGAVSETVIAPALRGIVEVRVTIKDIITKPQQALSQEVCNVLVSTIDKEPAVVNAVIRAVQAEAPLAVGAEVSGASVGQRVAGVAEELSAESAACALRHRTVLSFQEAGILDAEGKLTHHAIEKSTYIDLHGEIRNPAIVKELIKDSSKISDWKKYTTETITLRNGQRVQIHYYRNDIVGKIDYVTKDFKVKDIVRL